MSRGRTRSSSPSRVPLVALLLLGGCLLPARASATDVQGVLSTHTVWTKRGSPYVLTGDVTVGWGVELVIQPGVRVIAASEDALRSGVDSRRVELIVDGTLVVKGTEARPVELTSQGERGSWYGLRVRGGRGTVIKGALILAGTPGPVAGHERGGEKHVGARHPAGLRAGELGPGDAGGQPVERVWGERAECGGGGERADGADGGDGQWCPRRRVARRGRAVEQHPPRQRGLGRDAAG